MTIDQLFAQLAAACADPGVVAARDRMAGRQVVWVLGNDLPAAMVAAFDYRPIRLVADLSVDRSAVDAMVGTEIIGERGRALLATVLALPVGDALLISHADNEQPQIFAALRELARTGTIARPQVHFLDLLTIDRPSTQRYNRIRVEQALAWLASLGGAASRDDLSAAIIAANRHDQRIGDLMEWRGKARLSGHEAHLVVAAAAILPRSEHEALIEAILAGVGARAPRSGRALLLSGSDIDDPGLVATIEQAGALVIGEDHGWGGDRIVRPLDGGGDPVDALSRATLDPWWGCFASATGRSVAIAERARRLAAPVLHLVRPGDEAAPWEVAALRRALDPGGIRLLSTAIPVDPRLIDAFFRDRSVSEKPVTVVEDEQPAPVRPRQQRSRKSLEAVARFGSYQREWFAEIRAQAAAGATFAAVNANAPQEMLRALRIPFVVNQWWASIVAAKQQSPRYADLLAAHHLPPAVEAYSAQGVAAAFDEDTALAPWGGLPRPDVLGEVMSTDATPRIFEAWQQATGAQLQRFERSIESRWDIPVDWWDGLADRWDEYIEPERLDLFEAELRAAIAELEALTGRALDPARLADVMDLVNEQEDHYRATRDLIAAAVPAPVSIVDTMPATMVPQWHRGTVWARDAARDFHDEVRARRDAGEAACPGERVRLMFVGRGIWGDTGFYQRWEESHGAVFVWSMYLGLAADGYIRRHDRGRDPLRALAARFVTMGDELRMPTWAGAWYVKEAMLHQVDGAVALSDADPFVLRALREAGIAVLELGMDNFSWAPDAEAATDRAVVAFLEGPAGRASAVRRSPAS
jgi:benzoyl-CoA reductase/2-hydroxyglutaryl-CoA dehydratase subunit BcrC/BadD/HgdB